jgi:gliding motility-associated-like protein
VICQGSSIRLTAPEGDSYEWESANGISETDIRDPVVAPTSSTRYVVHVSNVCGTVTDSAFVDVIEPLAEAWPDTVVCPGQVVPLFASDGSSFAWSPPQGLDDASLQAPTALVNAPTMYTVTITDAFGCIASASLMLGTHPPTPVDAGPDRVVELGRSTQLSATGEGSFSWTPAETLDHDDIATPVASPLESTTYTVTLTDANGCTAKDAVTIIIPGSLYVPNTFTPNGDGTNDAFGAWGKDIKTIELMVFNRWGELIWSTEQLGGRWDGTYKGVESPIDTYVWKVKATEVSGNIQEMVGHVNLLR